MKWFKVSSFNFQMITFNITLKKYLVFFGWFCLQDKTNGFRYSTVWHYYGKTFNGSVESVDLVNFSINFQLRKIFTDPPM